MAHHKMIFFSSQIAIFGLVCIAVVTFINSSNPLIITLAFLLFIISSVIPLTLFYPLSINLIPEAKGQIVAMIEGFHLIVTALCLQIAAYFYQGSFQNIGIILFIIMLVAIISLFFVIKNKSLMKFF